MKTLTFQLAYVNQWFEESWERLQEERLFTGHDGQTCHVALLFGMWLFDRQLLTETDPTETGSRPMALGMVFKFHDDADYIWRLEQ